MIGFNIQNFELKIELITTFSMKIFIMNQHFYPNNGFYFNLNNPTASKMHIIPNGGASMIHGRRQLFSYEEDEQLKKLVEQFGDKDWKFIARKMPGRSTRQCRERYKNYLSPEIKNGPWTKEEDELLREKYNEYGPHWSSISKFFKSRSDVNIKNRWSALSFHMNNDTNNGNVYLYCPHSVQKKAKVFYPASQNFCFHEPNSFYSRGGFSTAPQNFYCSNMNQMINDPQPHFISNQAFTNNNEKSNNDENEAQNEEDDDVSDENLPPPPMQNNEIKNIINEPISVTVQSNPENSSISLSSVPMSVNFSGPLPPLLQKPKVSLHFQQSSLLVSNANADSPNDLTQKRNASSPLSSNQLNPTSPISEDNHSRLQQEELKIQRPMAQIQIQSPHFEKDEEKIHFSHPQQPKEDISNNNSLIRIIQKIDTTNSNNPPQISSSTNSNTSSSNQPLTIHKPQNQQHSSIKQTINPNVPDSNFLINFPFPQSLLSTSLLTPNDQQESILSTDSRIDDASINTETEVLTNTFPNFGGRLW